MEYDIPEFKLVRAIHDAPGILERFGSGKKKYIAHIQAALLNRLKEDKKVYHGLAGHFFVQGVSHALKVRIISDMEDRVALEMQREGISAKEAMRVLKKDDEERRKWSLSLYGIDTSDSSLYDLVIHIRNIKVDDAADIICHTVGMDRFKTTEVSRRIMDDLALAAQVKVKLINWYPDVEVHARKGDLVIKVDGMANQEGYIRQQVLGVVTKIPGVNQAKVSVSHIDG